MRLLRQSTSVDVPIGPFVDQTDGFTPESALTLTQPDIRLKKNGGAWAQKNAAQTLTHEENGNYEVTLDATDTNTLGLLRLHVNESGALPVWEDFWVVTPNFWDSLFSTDFLQVDLTQWLGGTPNTLSAGNVSSFAAALAVDAIQMDQLSITSGLKPANVGTCTGGTSSSITLGGGASSTNDFYKGMTIYLTSGTGAGQARLCTAYNGSTKVATVEPNWATVPVNASTIHAVLPAALALGVATGGIATTSFAAGAINAAAIAAGAIDDDAVAADMDAYHAKVWVVRESTTADHYAVVFFKNGQPVTTGITSPTIQVIKASDGTDLIASTALTEVAGLGIYKKDESTNKLTGGAIYFAKVQATIDGSTRQWLQQIGRDSV